MCCTPSLPLHPGTLYPGVAVPFRVTSMGQIDLNYGNFIIDLFRIYLYMKFHCGIFG